MGETSGTAWCVKEPRQKHRRVPTALCKLFCLSKARSSAREEEEDHWEVMEERRRRRIAFENLAKDMLRYLDNCNEVKEDGQKIFEIFWQEGEEFFLPAGPDGTRSGKAQSTCKEGVKTWVVKYRC